MKLTAELSGARTQALKEETEFKGKIHSLELEIASQQALQSSQGQQNNVAYKQYEDALAKQFRSEFESHSRLQEQKHLLEVQNVGLAFHSRL